MSLDNSTTAIFLFPFQINMNAEKELKKKIDCVQKEMCVQHRTFFSVAKTYVCLLTLTYNMRHSNNVILCDLNKIQVHSCETKLAANKFLHVKKRWQLSFPRKSWLESMTSVTTTTPTNHNYHDHAGNWWSRWLEERPRGGGVGGGGVYK